MKKILLFFVAASLLISCSSEDDTKEAPSSIKAKIDGIDYNFTVFDTNKESYTDPDSGYSWTDVEIDGALSNDSTRHVSFVVEQGIVGPDASWRFTYFVNNVGYDKNDGFTFVVTESTDRFVKGNFSGTVVNEDTGEEIVITDGTFSVSH